MIVVSSSHTLNIMIWYELALLFFLTAMTEAALTPDPNQAVTIARCRSSCLERYHDDITCQGDDCTMCWQLCQLLVVDAFSWTPLCTLEQRRLCTPGCRTACDSLSETPPQRTRAGATFGKAPNITMTSEGESRITWDIPTARFPKEDSDAISWVVYVMYKRDGGDTTWYTERITRERSIIVTSQEYMQLHLVAVTSLGVIAECYPGQRYDGVAWTTTMKPNDVTHDVMPAPEIKMDTASRVLQVHVTWSFSGSDVPDTVIVQWSRMSCSDTAGDSCQLPDQDLYLSVRPSVGKTAVVLPGVTYNSGYRLEIFHSSFDPEHVVYFHTTRCESPDPTMTLCRGHDLISPDRVDYESGYYCVLALCCCLVLTCIVLVVCVLRRYITIRQDIEAVVRSSAVYRDRPVYRGSVEVRHRAGYCKGQVTNV